MTIKEKIPVLIVTGFLGAGKTTFINHVIHKNAHLKLALIENEFGEESVDSQLITGIDGQQIFELSNGCICCSITNEFSMALIQLADQFPNIDYLLIETTGIANLSQVIKPFFADKELANRFQLSGSVCVVDAINFHQMIKNQEQQMQLIHSDYILINKAENVEHQKLDEINRMITSYNSSAKAEITNYSQTTDFCLSTFETDVQSKTEKKLAAPIVFRIVESSRFTTFTHRFSGYINLERFKYWFNYFAAINSTDIYRIKGILYAQGEATKTIVQSVGGAVNYTEGSIISPSEEISNTLVFIGKNIDFERIVYELDQYLSEEINP